VGCFLYAHTNVCGRVFICSISGLMFVMRNKGAGHMLFCTSLGACSSVLLFLFTHALLILDSCRIAVCDAE
jgi:hypothetical protein